MSSHDADPRDPGGVPAMLRTAPTPPSLSPAAAPPGQEPTHDTAELDLRAAERRDADRQRDGRDGGRYQGRDGGKEDVETGPVPRLETTAIRVGSLLRGRYRLTTLIGRGGMADVYRAVDEVIGRSVAIKVFRPGSDAVGDRQRFLGEIRTIAGLAHPHLVALYDGGQQDIRPWCVMSYLDGGTLADIRTVVSGSEVGGEDGGDDSGEDGAHPASRSAHRPNGTPATPQWIAQVGAQIADALDYIHERGIVHRDVKPSNVLLDGDGDAYLADFGVAQLVDATRLTATGALLGTAAYLSPEQVMGRPATPAVDVYALALVLLEALTGEREFPGTAVESAVARLSRSPQVPDHLGPDWAELLHAMTAVEPTDRPDAAAVASWLTSLASRPGYRPGAVPAPRTVTRLSPVPADPQTGLRTSTYTPHRPGRDPNGPATPPTSMTGRPTLSPGSSASSGPDDAEDWSGRAAPTGPLWQRVLTGARRNPGRSAGIAATGILAVLTAWQISVLGPNPVRVGGETGQGTTAGGEGLTGGGLVAPSTAASGETIGAEPGLGRVAGGRRAIQQAPAPANRGANRSSAPVKAATVNTPKASTSPTAKPSTPAATATTPKPTTAPTSSTTTAVPPPTEPPPTTTNTTTTSTTSTATSPAPSTSPAG